MFKVILWDIDGTLLNFEKAESYAIRKCFLVFGLGECTDEMLAHYSKINKRYWEKLEAGILTKEQVLVGRFEEFFQKEGLPTYAAQEFNKEYQLRLGDETFFHDNGKEIVFYLKSKKIKQYAVTNGTFIAQQRKLKQSGLDRLLDGLFISDVVGYEKPSVEFFEAVWQVTRKYKKEEILLIGDSLTSDIQGANNVDLPCCWYNPKHLKNDKNLRIDYEISNLNEILSILENS